MFKKLLCVIALAGCAISAQAADSSKSQPILRKDLLTALLSPEKTVGKVEVKEVTLTPKQEAPLHLHPCPVFGVITEGSVSYQVQGSDIHHLKVGDAFYEPANVKIPIFRNDGDSPARFVVVYLLGTNENEIIRMIQQ